MLAQRFAAVQAERDALYDKFEASVYDVAQKTGENTRCKHVSCCFAMSRHNACAHPLAVLMKL